MRQVSWWCSTRHGPLARAFLRGRGSLRPIAGDPAFPKARWSAGTGRRSTPPGGLCPPGGSGAIALAMRNFPGGGPDGAHHRPVLGGPTPPWPPRTAWGSLPPPPGRGRPTLDARRLAQRPPDPAGTQGRVLLLLNDPATTPRAEPEPADRQGWRIVHGRRRPGARHLLLDSPT